MKDTEKNKEQLIAELAESEEKYRKLFENMMDGFVLHRLVTDKNGHPIDYIIEEINKTAKKNLFWNKKNIKGKKATEVYIGDTPFIEKYAKVAQTGKAKHFINYYPRFKKWYKITSFCPEKGYFANIFRDITEGKQVEKVIQESESRFRELFNHISSGVAIYEAKNNGRDFIIKDLNQAAEKIEKVKKEDIIGKNVLKVFPGVKDFGLFKVFQKVYKTGKPQHYPISLYKDQRITGWRENYVCKLPSDEVAAIYNDITERKQAEKELKDSEEHLKILFGYAPDAYYLLSLTDIPKATKLLAKNLRRLPTGPDEFVLNRKDNTKVTVEISTYPVKIKGRALALGIARDITERKKAEKTLAESEKKYRTVFENTGTATLIIEEDTIISMVNTQFEKLSGYSKDEIENKIKWTDFVIPEDLKVMIDYHTARRKAGETPPTEYEFRFIDRKGNIKNMFLKVGIIPGSKKSIASLVDTTERIQAEENVKNIKDELEILLDSVPAIIFYKDIEGRIIRANKALADSLKVHIKDIVGKTTEELFPKEQAENMRKDDKEVMISGKPKRNIIQPYTTPDGIRCLISDKVLYRDKEGKVTGVIGLAKDITVQKKSEEELKQSYQKLKKTMDAAIDTMSRIIEAKDPYTSGHQHRVCQLAVPLAQELGLPEDKIEGIRIASLIHDIGKIGLPTEILSKPSKLTDIEFSLIKGHSQIGYDILKSIDFSYPIAQIVLQHHEKLNGSGYPNKLKSDEIMLEAKIIGIADVVEAMSSFRPYRPALGIDKALEEITQNRGTLYAPEVVDACLKLFKEKGFKFE
jgi:PAS domain S-box-containing protein